MAAKGRGIILKRAYEAPAESDGLRIRVERIRPRGLRKEDAGLHTWIKEIAPSNRSQT